MTSISTRQNAYLQAGFFGLLIVLLLLIIVRLLPGLTTSFSVADYDFDSRELQAKPERRLSGWFGDDSALEISLEFRIDPKRAEQLREVGVFHWGLFQTANHGEGVRVELAAEQGVFRWAMSIAGNFYQIEPDPAVDRWQRLTLILSDQVATVTIDGVRQMHFTYHGLVLADEIVSGQGYSAERVFPGQIRKFKVTTTRFDSAFRVAIKLLTVCLVIVMALWLACTCLARSRSPRSTECNSAVSWASLVTFVIAFLVVKSGYGAVTSQSMASDVAVSAFVAAILRTIFSNIRPNRLRRPIFWISLLVCYATFVVVTAGALYLVDRGTGSEVGLTFDEIGVIHQSNTYEAFEFFVSFFSNFEKAAILLYPLLPTGALALFSGLRAPIGVQTVLPVAVMGLAALVVGLGNSSGGIIATFYEGWKYGTESARLFERNRLARVQSQTIKATTGAHGETYVLVIGESANRDHFSTYGYFRRTTPWFDSLKGNQRSIVFENAYSSYAHTVPSLMHALTSANQYNRQSTLTTPSLIETFKAAGFNTVWLTEQGVTWTDSALHKLAAESNHFQQVRAPGLITEKFRKTIGTLNPRENNLVVVHLMGSHADYRNRVPQGYSIEWPASSGDLGTLSSNSDFVENILNPYDTSIRFTDDQLAEISAVLEASNIERYGLIFASDHGEDVYGRRFHDASKFSFAMVRIPLAMRYSDGWISKHHDIFEKLAKNREKLFTLDLLYDTLLGIASIDASSGDQDFDFTSADYSLTPETAVTMTAPLDRLPGVFAGVPPRRIATDPALSATANLRELNRQQPQRFLANRADSLVRLRNARLLGFEGAEVNVTIPSMRIGHYPEFVHERTLAQYLSHPDVQSMGRLWFDLKLERGHQLTDSLPALEELAPRFSLKQRVLLESPERGLGSFAALGWQTSFYFIPERWPGCLANTLAMKHCASDVARVVVDEGVSGISFDLNYYRFVADYLAPLLPKKVVFHVFGNRVPSPFDPEFPRRIAEFPEGKDARVRTILLDASLVAPD